MRSACFCSLVNSGIAALMKRLAPATSTLRLGLCSCSHFFDSNFEIFLLYASNRACGVDFRLQVVT